MIITEKPKSKAMVVLLVDSYGYVTLARKKQAIHHDTGEIGYSLGTYNGYGGKQEWFDFRSITVTAIREAWGEAQVFIFPWNLKRMARVYFYTSKEGQIKPFMNVTFFIARKWWGEAQEGREMGPPELFLHEGDMCPMPYGEMMPADEILLQSIFDGKHGVYQAVLFGKKDPAEIQELDEEL